MSYQEYITSQKWFNRRKGILGLDGYRCVLCGRKYELQVHHLTYERLGAESPDDLATLCVRCHNDVHIAQRGELASEKAMLQMQPIEEGEWQRRLEKKEAAERKVE